MGQEPRGKARSLSELIASAAAGDHVAGRDIIKRFIDDLRERPRNGTVRVPADLASYIADRLEDALRSGDTKHHLRIKNPSHRPKNSEKAARDRALAVEVMQAEARDGEGRMRAYQKVAYRRDLSVPTVWRAFKRATEADSSLVQCLVTVKTKRADLSDEATATLHAVQRERRHRIDAKNPQRRDIAETAKRLGVTPEEVLRRLARRKNAAF